MYAQAKFRTKNALYDKEIDIYIYRYIERLIKRQREREEERGEREGAAIERRDRGIHRDA